MPKDTDPQLDFDFRSPKTVNAAQVELSGDPVATDDSATPTIINLGQHRIAKVARESAAHFSAILNLVAHLK